MSYNTWHDYGYGIKVDDIGEVPPEKNSGADPHGARIGEGH
jgi:hypothetical protein